MVQGYYTLQEAAQFLGVGVDELKQLAQKGKLRSFQDRGTLRFRIQDIQELARTRGGASDPDLALGDASLPKPPSSAARKAKAGGSPSSAARKAKAGGSPSSAARKAQGPKSGGKKDMPDVFDFALDNEEKVDLGDDFLGPQSAGSKGSKKNPTPPVGTPGSDSDVRLVSDGSDVTFSVGRESDIKAADSAVKIPDPNKPSSTARKSSQVSLGSGVVQPKPGPSSKQPSPKPGSGPQPADSGVRLVPLDSDSDVKIVGASSDEVSIGFSGPSGHTDSNVRLDRVQLPPADSAEGNMMLTEEINLDEEIAKLEQRDKDHSPTKMKAKSELKFPSSSPFELSDSEMKMPDELMDGPATPSLAESSPADSSDFEMTAQGPQDGSSDFDLVAGAGGSPVEDSDADFSLEASDDQALGDDTAGLTSSSSGISLSNPVDAGISLEEGGGQSGDDVDFDLSLEVEDTPRPSLASSAADSDGDFQLKVGDNTPRPVEDHPAESSSEFELSLDSDSDLQTSEGQDSDDLDLSLNVEDHQPEGKADDDSEFEINLDNSDEAPAEAPVDADSEFELTLDDSDNVSADEDAAPQVKSKKKGGSDDEQDIFETDFEVPALDESDETTVADSELESSDFDLALDDSELANEEESGSQVVALDEEDAETLVDSDGAAVVDDVEVEEESSDFGDLDADTDGDADAEVEVDEDADEETATSGKTRTVVKEKLVEPAPWGVLPVVFMLPCVIVMFLVGILGYETMVSSAGMQPPGPLTVLLAKQFGEKLTDPANAKK